MDVRRAVKGLAALAVDRSGARRAIARACQLAAGGRRVVVIGYHRVCADFEAEREHAIESCLISRRTFAQHVDFLAERFELATMSRAVDVLTGRAPAERDLAVITFDDGYRDVLENALPILRSIGAPATIYLSSSVIGQSGHFPHDRLYSLLRRWSESAHIRGHASSFTLELMGDAVQRGTGPRQWLYRLIRQRTPAELSLLCDELSEVADTSSIPPRSAGALSWDEVRALKAGGFEIGAHTTSHCVLTHLSAGEVEADLLASREAIESAIGAPVRHFAYCNGYYNETVIAALKRTGYASAVTTEARINRLGDDPFRIARTVLWEKSAYGGGNRVSPSLLRCQLDGAWGALGFDSSESGARPEPARESVGTQQLRRLA